MNPDRADQALDALAFVENVLDGHPGNWQYMLDTIPRDDLLVGLTALSRSLLISLAANTGSTVADVVEAQRACYLAVTP